MQRTHFTAGYTLYVTNKAHLNLIIYIFFFLFNDKKNVFF